MMGRGGERVGGNWRGVTLTHQATVYKNKKRCGQGNGIVFLYVSASTNRTAAEITKMSYVVSLTSVTLFSLQVSFC